MSKSEPHQLLNCLLTEEAVALIDLVQSLVHALPESRAVMPVDLIGPVQLEDLMFVEMKN